VSGNELDNHEVPFDEGMLDVGDGNRVHYSQHGDPDGKPMIMVHGGPGSGCTTAMARALHPAYRMVLLDQRGCGLSTPHASDPATDLSRNTTEHLVADLERLRVHLGIERWMLTGGSWGSTLALAYAQRHPEPVTEIVLSAITTTRRSEVDWLYRGAGRFFPDQWEAFRDGVDEPDRDGDTPHLLAAYGRLLADPDPQVRQRAAVRWATWEDAVLSTETTGTPNLYGNRPDDELVALARICAHYYGHGAWLAEGALIRDAGRLAGIPGVLVHGRLDLSGPADTAWELARAWPDAELHVVEGAGHKGHPEKRAIMQQAMSRFAV
jgi:proline iminopeptidase